MLAGIAGGKLQGVEAAYLARKAGWEIRVVDRRAGVPACRLGDSFVQADVAVENNLDGVFGDVDVIIPALEDAGALQSIMRWSRQSGVALAFDPRAYAVSSSKLKSAELFQKLGLPAPLPWPRCGFPLLAKPAEGSGSQGVGVYQDLDSLKDRFALQFPPPGWVLEEFLDGSQHSLEVVGRPGNYQLLQVTDLYVDQNFDCKRVIAPSNLSLDLIAVFEKLALAIAEALDLHGIMDVEVICSRGELKILEIDARLPSQTPTAVYWSTQKNMVGLLGDLYAAPQNRRAPAGDIVRGTVYEHVRVAGDCLTVCGERIMTEGGPLKLAQDFFGADEALTNFAPGQDRWVATLIFSETDRQRAWEKRNRGIANIARHLGIKQVVDPQPPGGSKK